MHRNILISDFDGTMTANDFYKLAAARVLPADALLPWEEYRAGTISHFEALRRIFSRIRASADSMRELIDAMEPDPLLAASVHRLKGKSWDVEVASAGCAWYIEMILSQAGLIVGHDLVVHANPGTYAPESGLTMIMATSSPFCCRETGVDKAGIVRFHQQRGRVIAFAGDGYVDLPAAKLVAADLRFARADLASALDDAGMGYRYFSRWTEVAEALLALRRHS